MPFEGSSSGEICGAILHVTPKPVTQINPQTPAEIEALINKALEKDRNLRYQHASDIRADLQRLKRDSETGRTVSSSSATRVTQQLSAANNSRLRMFGASTVLLVAAVTLLVAWLHFRSPQAKTITDKDTIVVADFENKTGEAIFDDALKQALSVELAQSPFLNIIPERKVSQTLRMMGRPTNEHVSFEVGREVCLRTGSKAVLGGTISSLGSHYLVELTGVACTTGETLASEQGEASSRDEVLKTLSHASSSLRTKLGESLPSVQKFDVPIEATTSSLEALKNYSVGVRTQHEKGDAPSILFHKRAIELDPNFALAYAALSVSYLNLSQPSLAVENATKAYQLRDRVSEREKVRITAYYFRAMGELDKEAQAYELWSAEYPRDTAPHTNLGTNYMYMGQYDKALAEFQEGLHLNPDNAILYANLGEAYLSLNRLDEAKAAFSQALAHKLDGGILRLNMYYFAFLEGNASQMEQQLTWAAGKPEEEDLLLCAQSDTEAYNGHVRAARDLSRRAVESAVRADSEEAAAQWQVNAALREAELGNAATAREGVAAALALSSGRDVSMAAALTLARVGDASRAEALAGELEKNYPTNTMLKLHWLPTIKAAIELSKKNSLQAIVLLEAAAPYELGSTECNCALYPAYVRGQALLLEHNGTAAVAEFQKLLDHRGIVLNSVTGSLAHLYIGRAYTMTGDAAKAKASYQEFLALWRDADPDVPILKQAKAEYAQLR
jgi:tetratricopeptide (TPR) repeat protein